MSQKSGMHKISTQKVQKYKEIAQNYKKNSLKDLSFANKLRTFQKCSE